VKGKKKFIDSVLFGTSNIELKGKGGPNEIIGDRASQGLDCGNLKGWGRMSPGEYTWSLPSKWPALGFCGIGGSSPAKRIRKNFEDFNKIRGKSKDEN